MKIISIDRELNTDHVIIITLKTYKKIPRNTLKIPRKGSILHKKKKVKKLIQKLFP